MNSKVDIITVVSGSPEITKNYIESVMSNTKISFRLIVADNKSDSVTIGYLRGLKDTLKDRLTLIENSVNLGWVKAVNQGFKISTAPYVCVMNNDVIVSAGWLDNMVDIMDKNPRIGLMNPRWEKGKFEGLKGDYVETDWCRGFCVLIKREVINKIGYFDEAYGFGYWEDHDYSVRAIKAGYICGLAVNSFVEHIKNVSVKSAMKQKEWDELFTRNRDIFEKKWGKPKRIIIVINRKISRDMTMLRDVIAKALELAREQNRVYILSNVYNLSLPSHTNVCYVKCLPVLFGLDVKARIFFNRNRKSNKRYNELYMGMDRSVLC